MEQQHGDPSAKPAAAFAPAPAPPGPAATALAPGTDHVAAIQAEWHRERPDLDVSPQAVIGRLHRLAARLTDELCLVYGRYGLGEGEFDVLAALRRAGAPFERAPGELAAHTMVTTGAMTKRIDRLERAGLVTRRRSEEDGRARVVALTDAGRRLIDEAFTAHMRNERRLLDLLTPEESAALEALLTTWQQRLEHQPPPA
ncbi:MarR family transcriptional regulator [Kitasatospora sp. CM 4170]|uniref:MarR family winged helix-turn-helix transcriptional regulator n=1 Tax=Kitasatospora aburaviensis TaxID=67265 RepID=A0ABW1F409_9ACTN|nr:MarR family transcriptional regulator [Kitasatospora sp. CM 4170]WNM49402.1 MarR family transcriptional regulator [Kitasatospora sp. CM 4170]